MSSTLTALREHAAARMESNDRLARVCPFLTAAERSRTPRPPHAFLVGCQNYFQLALAHPALAAIAHIDPGALKDKLEQMEALDVALIQNAREGQLLRDARIAVAGELWAPILEAYRMAKLLTGREEAARCFATEVGRLFDARSRG